VLEAITSSVGVYLIQLVIGVVYSQVGMTCVKEFVHMNNWSQFYSIFSAYNCGFISLKTCQSMQ